MLLTVILGLFSALLMLPFGNKIKTRWSALLTLVPAIIFIYYLQYVPAVSTGTVYTQILPWVPSMDINFAFRLDGLSLLFALLISGIGSAIFVYAIKYLKGHPYFDRFFGYLCLFMAAMLGVVLSDNIFSLFIFWELTSISSFFLIGFNNDSDESRKSALRALTVTGMGGFFLLAGLTLLGNIAGTYQISDLVAARDLIIGHNLYPLILALICLGAFTKSAQFPFHFWLPGAMKAPTPVSAYLHSATMVKAGIYLLARFNPVLGQTELWSYTLMIVGGFTMIFAAFHALFRLDLKSILAYSTISALGVLTFLIGLGTKDAIIAAVVFIVVHALYKATLFMVTGIIDHETGTRDISKLAGLRKIMPWVAVAGGLAALSSAGLPLTFGFIGKDLIYAATLEGGGTLSVILTSLAVGTNIALVAAGFMAGLKPFFGALPETLQDTHRPYAALWIPPLILGLFGLIAGIFPGIIGNYFSLQAADAVFGGNTDLHLALWHGVNTVLILSLATLGTGTLVYLANKPNPKKLKALERLNVISPQYFFDLVGQGLLKLSQGYTNVVHNGYLRSYHLKIILFAEALLAYKLWLSGPIQLDWSSLTALSIYEVAVVLILIGAVGIVLSTPYLLTAVVAMTVVGYCICLMFVFYSAPDLAMTQFTIDTLTTVLFVLVLYKLPPFLKLESSTRRYRDIVVAMSFGVILSLIALKVINEPIDKSISQFYGENAYLLAKGKNVVNVILVDFRGIDTMFETVVLSIAAIGVYSLLKLRLKSSEKE
ncbi:putative monovalent cation/H+ antiporter subunit A [Sphingobacterium chungjuense]|uniref:putative monovalent cation/H+ antiporter subunit A n=1 Tax=Sphingobacterium chungjuense TaxID=2675553 RepID=UPI00140DF4A4|nr:putative monovalent cation/H+ antiporter subunit A [Sphingobacterium chungjuense]